MKKTFLILLMLCLVLLVSACSTAKSPADSTTAPGTPQDKLEISGEGFREWMDGFIEQEKFLSQEPNEDPVRLSAATLKIKRMLHIPFPSLSSRVRWIRKKPSGRLPCTTDPNWPQPTVGAMHGLPNTLRRYMLNTMPRTTTKKHFFPTVPWHSIFT